jgi:hypothetical protein
VNTTLASSLIVITLSLPVGASSTDVTLMVMVRGVTSRFAPAPSSCTWNVKLACAAPCAFSPGVYRRLPALTSAIAIDCPALTAPPFSVTSPALAKVVIVTASKGFAGASSGSVKPKSRAVKVYSLSSFVVTVFDVPRGASFTERTVMLLEAICVLNALVPPLPGPANAI